MGVALTLSSTTGRGNAHARAASLREDTMNAKLAADAESLYRIATRLQRVGLVFDRAALSPAQRRAAFVLQCLAARCPEKDEPRPVSIGFAYPNAREV